MGKKSVTDLSYLHEMSLGDEGIVLETVQVFLKSAPQSVINLQNYGKHQEWEKLAAEAHKVKTDFVYMGMSEAHQLIINIEKNAKDKRAGEIEGQVETLAGICSKALKELAAKADEMKSKAG